MKELIPLLESVAQARLLLVLVVCDIEGEAVTTLVVNKLGGALDVCVVEAPSFGDYRKQATPVTRLGDYDAQYL